MISPESFPALAAKLSPAIYFIVVIFNSIFNPGFEAVYLMVWYAIAFFTVPIFKELIFKPIYKLTHKETLPVLGLGKRPAGAKDCSLSGTNELSQSFGMPSGHSSLTMFLTTYLILITIYMDYNQFQNPLAMKIIYSIICLLQLASSIFIMYSRIRIAGCHTLQQVIVGAIIGIIFGFITFYTKPYIKKSISL